jgi:hypothetical protein
VNQRHIFRRQFCAREFESPKHVSRGDIYFLESIAPTIKPTIAPGIIPDTKLQQQALANRGARLCEGNSEAV